MRRRTFLLPLICFLLPCLILPVLSNEAFIPLAEAGCDTFTHSLVCDTLSDVLTDESFSRLTRDDAGRVTDIVLDTAEVNRFTARFTAELNRRLADRDTAVFSIPLGNLTGIALLSGHGPSLSLHVVPLGSATAEIVSSFRDAGINQTEHTVSLKVLTSVRLLPPFSGTVSAETVLPLSSEVIIGNIPTVYADSPR